PGTVLTLPPASGTVYFCASNSTGQLRYVTSPAQCTSNEFPVFVTPNDTAPSVLSTSPANGATHVAVNTNITVQFSEAVTFSTSSFTLQCPSGTPKTFAVSGSGTSTATLDPTADLPEGTTCAVTVLASQISDVDSGDPPDNLAANYVFSFTTADAAPSVASTSPADGADHVAVNTNIVVNFSEPVTASGSSFTLECPTGTPKSFSVSGSPGSSITLDPTSDLPEGTVCAVKVIATGISDVDTSDPPDHPASNTTFSFTTQDAAPSVSTTAPADGAADVARDTTVQITFSESVSATSNAFSIECPTGTSEAFSQTSSPA